MDFKNYAICLGALIDHGGQLLLDRTPLSSLWGMMINAMVYGNGPRIQSTIERGLQNTISSNIYGIFSNRQLLPATFIN